jgi:CheY-like chemotaxis protein
MIFGGEENAAVETVNVSLLIREMIELLKVSISKHAIMVAELGEDLPFVQANPAQLRQVLMNLITNASEAIGDQDGVIRVTTRQVKVDRNSPVAASERLVAEGDYVQLEVSDTGRGMTMDMQARAFDPFFTTKSPGQGLGLAVVQGIVRSVGGTIRLISAPGEGTTFQILLPCTEQAAQATASTLSRTEKEKDMSRAATILVAEDEDLLRQPVSKMLRKTGFTVIEANNGSAALDLIRTHKDAMDVLLLDISLPGASSREVFEEAKRLRPDLAVIVTSANSQETAAVSLCAERIERFIRKPYSFLNLVDMIREIQSS